MAKTPTLTKAHQALIDKAVQEALAKAQEGLVQAQAKPELVSHLRATWRTSAEHLAAQIQRFVILTALAAFPSIGSLLAGGKFDATTLLAFIGPFAYVAYKQIYPELSAKAVDSAPGVTIVPDQVGVPTAEVPIEDAQVQVPLPEEGGGPPDVGEAILGYVGALLFAVGLVLLLVVAVGAHAVSAFGLVLLIIGLVTMVTNGLSESRRDD